VTATACAHCGAVADTADEFCEVCGASLRATGSVPVADAGGDVVAGEERSHLIAPPGVRDTHPTLAPRSCDSCGGSVGDDGWCTVCGARASNGRDHTTQQPSPSVAGVCDRGLQHPRNEDAMALAALETHAVLVVCDGVSSATDSDAAALAASRSACDLLAAAAAPSTSSPAARIGHWAAAIEAAGGAANDAVVAGSAAVGTVENPPSCTLAIAVVDGDLLTAGWIGDSRVYWLGDDGAAEQLSVDDSWATEQVAAGVPVKVAEADVKAHAITRWLGVDAPAGPASTAATAVRSPGWALVCSDGLWNYCSGASELAALLREHDERAAGDPLTLATSLVDWANEQGGHDNITVALARVTPTRSVTQGAT
jgi:serine/threonine protein phosphatase PrpC/RNA polymerase subunit RPABC4/transcription elongation factor Spt4